MAIAPPSDIVLDVAQAADPSRLQAATAKLARLAAGNAVASDSFDGYVKSAATDKASSSAVVPRVPIYDAPVIRTQPGSPYQKFEAMVLQSFVENILPKDENLFGDAASADMCRSLLAEQLSNQLAKGGTLGIAKLIKAAHPPNQSASAAAPTPVTASVLAGPRAVVGTQSQPSVRGASLDPPSAELAPASPLLDGWNAS